MKVNQETAGIIAPTPEQREQATRGKRHTGGIGQGTQDSSTKVKGQASHEEGGARSNVERIQDDTTTPQNHNHNAATNRRRQRRRREGGQMKKKQNKVKINSSEHHKSDYRRAEKEKKRIKKIKG